MSWTFLSLRNILLWSTSFFYCLSFIWSFCLSIGGELTFTISWDALCNFKSFFIIGDAFKILPYFLVIFLHGYHLFPFFFSNIFYFLDCHDSNFLYVMIDLFIIQRLHYCIPLNHLLQFSLPLFLGKHLLTFFIYEAY